MEGRKKSARETCLPASGYAPPPCQLATFRLTDNRPTNAVLTRPARPGRTSSVLPSHYTVLIVTVPGNRRQAELVAGERRLSIRRGEE